MIQEDKQLLLKDLSARLPYGVKCKVNFDDGTSDVMKLSQFPDGLGIWGFYKDGCCGMTDDFKPYLRPMSGMTEEEEKEYNGFLMDVEYYPGKYFAVPATSVVDWLLSHHFDFRGLIEKGLALEALKDMYKNEC